MVKKKIEDYFNDSFGRFLIRIMQEDAELQLRDLKQRCGEDVFTRIGAEMAFKGWHLAAMEDYGYMDTDTELINRVARILADSPNDEIDTEEFRDACYEAGVDPDSFTQSDLDELQRKINTLT